MNYIFVLRRGTWVFGSTTCTFITHQTHHVTSSSSVLISRLVVHLAHVDWSVDGVEAESPESREVSLFCVNGHITKGDQSDAHPCKAEA